MISLMDVVEVGGLVIALEALFFTCVWLKWRHRDG